jgi:hypothetical protein
MNCSLGAGRNLLELGLVLFATKYLMNETFPEA